MLTGAEWLRGHLLSGFPWNTFGYALTEPLALAQSVSLFGIWSLTFLCIAICASPAVLADDAADTPHPRRAPLFGILILVALASYGTVRLWQHPTEYVSGVKLRIMQPNLQQDEKFNYAAKTQIMERYLRLSDRATGPQSNGVHDVTHFDLAGIGVSVFPHARAGRAGADRRAAETFHRTDHRRRASPRRPPDASNRAPIIRSM